MGVGPAKLQISNGSQNRATSSSENSNQDSRREHEKAKVGQFPLKKLISGETSSLYVKGVTKPRNSSRMDQKRVTEDKLAEILKANPTMYQQMYN